MSKAREWRYEWIDYVERWGDANSGLRAIISIGLGVAAFLMRGLMLQMILGQGLPAVGVPPVTISVPAAALAVMLVAGALAGPPDQFRPTPIYSAVGGLVATLFYLAFLAATLWVLT